MAKSDNVYVSSNNPYPLKAPYQASEGFDPAAEVQVDPGATLDCSLVTDGQELSNLTVDLTAGEGMGTLKGVKLSATGTINVICASSKVPTGDLPLAFVDSVTGGDLSGWTVKVNGVVTTKRILFWNGNRLTLSGVGMIILLK